VLPDPPRRRCSAASARSGRIGARSRTGAPTQGAGEDDDPAFDDPLPAVEPLAPPDGLAGAGELDPPSPPPPRGTADPTVSPFDGRDDCCSPCGRPRSCAQADPTVSDNAAAAASPTENV
jgi:hypothetical protein